MDTNYNTDVIRTIYLENIENFGIINDEIYKIIISNIEYSYVLILFTISCFIVLLCNIKNSKKSKNEYILVKDSKPITAERIDNV
tara:strand:+ start:657 stop:911 length:255 start_codon:yes stop_codon:yes gene_type:complete